MIDKIIDYYENYDEDGRLNRDNAHLIEFLTTIHYFDKLFKPNSKILDTCAGTGKYSIYLSNKGHEVTALDLVEHNINIIKSKEESKKLKEIATCNVLDLERFEEQSFDVVLCMGAMYHLKTVEERKKAIEQCRRVLKTNGILAIAYLNKYAFIVANVNDGLTNMDEAISVFDNSGEFVFTITTPSEIDILAKECGLTPLHNVGVDGIAFSVADKINSANSENFEKWMDYHYKTCEEQSILGYSLHGLWIGVK